MPASPSRLAVACLLAGAVAAGAACASESDDGGSGGGGGDGGSVSGHLAALPAPGGDDIVQVTYGDLARAEEIAGIERPDDVSDPDALVDWLLEVEGQSRFAEDAEVAVLPPEVAQTQYSASDMEGFVEDVGWSIVDVDTFAERYTPPRPVAVLDGDFDDDTLAGALDDGDDGVWVAGDPDGGMDVEGTTPARPLGETLWLDLDGDRLTVARERDDVAAARDADGGDGTLADDPALGPLAATLDDHDVYSALLLADEGMASSSPADRVLGRDASPEQVEAVEDELTPCEGMTGVAAGVAHDGEPLIVLAIAHADEAAAEANVDIVSDTLAEGEILSTGQPWSERLTVESVEADGTVVVATARPNRVVLAQWSAFLFQRDFPPC